MILTIGNYDEQLNYKFINSIGKLYQNLVLKLAIFIYASINCEKSF